STAARVPRCPTRKAVAIVVASTATHSVPRLAASTASTIVATNACTSTPYRPAVRKLERPDPTSASRKAGLALVAISATAPITITMKALSASARSWPATALTGPSLITRPASATPDARSRAAAPAPTQRVDGRQPYTAYAAPARAGTSTGTIT